MGFWGGILGVKESKIVNENKKFGFALSKNGQDRNLLLIPLTVHK
jgi:hypothetical protein